MLGGAIRLKIMSFLSSSNNTNKLPFIAAIASGLYPILHCYNNNFTLVNSWSQFVFFIISFMLLPWLVISSAYFVFKRNSFLKSYSKYIIPVLNYCIFLFLLVISVCGFKKKILAIALLLAFIFGVYFYRFIKKVIVFQLLLAILALAKLVPDFYKAITYSNKWMEQPDNIQEVVFKTRPNVYVIQPDGYANFSELRKGYYDFDNTEFETFLSNNGFKLYSDYRSNYYSTLSSNTSLFTMKHHYYNHSKYRINELFNARDIIVGENPVISVLKNNDYKTFLLLEHPYLLVNRPEIGYDHCNINYRDFSFLSAGFDIKKNLINDLKDVIGDNEKEGNFYFIEKIGPGHITVYNDPKSMKKEERVRYLKELKEANIWLKEIIQLINSKDKNSLIVIAADHGGFVGFNSTSESKTMVTDKDLINSIFTSALAIKWSGVSPEFEAELKTPVNLFRILFSYLSEDDVYLEHLQENESFIPIEKGAPHGIYKYIDEKGEVVFDMLVSQ